MLLDAGHQITGTTLSLEKQAKLHKMGIDAAVVDVFDSQAPEKAVKAARPDFLIHHLTDLGGGIDPAAREEALRSNTCLRREETANLITAGRGAGVRRVLAQSIAWAHASKAPPFTESDRVDVDAAGLRAILILGGVVPLENAVFGQEDLGGLGLCYGRFYGLGNWSTKPAGAATLHVAIAACAAFLGANQGPPGAYNIADLGGDVANDKEPLELSWRNGFRGQWRD